MTCIPAFLPAFLMSLAETCIIMKYILNVICQQKWWISIYCLLYIFRKWNKRFLQSTGSKHVRIVTLCVPTVVYRDHFCVQYNSVLVCVHVYMTVHACMHSMCVCIVHVDIHFLQEASLFIFPITCVLIWIWELGFPQQQTSAGGLLCSDMRQPPWW